MSGESDENFEGVTKYFPDILSPDQNFYTIFLSLTETFIQNWIQIFTPWITEISALNVELQVLFSSLWKRQIHLDNSVGWSD